MYRMEVPRCTFVQVHELEMRTTPAGIERKSGTGRSLCLDFQAVIWNHPSSLERPRKLVESGTLR